MAPLPYMGIGPGAYSRNELANIAYQRGKIYGANQVLRGQVGTKRFYSQGGFSTWTPSVAGKYYVYIVPLTKYLWDGTFVTRSEAVNVDHANLKGSFFEAYSAGKFAAWFTMIRNQQADAPTSGEQNLGADPTAVILSQVTDVLGIDPLKFVSSRCVAGSLWYMKVDLSSMLNRAMKFYLKSHHGTDPAKMPDYPDDLYLAVVIAPNATTDVNYQMRQVVSLIMATAGAATQ